jgi:hypothetical protein
MLYRQKFDTFIRIYNDIGYIVNKSDFGDRIFDKSGAIFLNALSRNPKSLETIVNEISNAFVGAEKEVIKKDVIDIYTMLEEDGFIISGETEDNKKKKDKRFSYSTLKPKTIKDDFTPVILRSHKNTQEFLEEHFKDKPQLTQLHIELTNRCNEKCIHCYIPQRLRTNDINKELYYDVLEQFNHLGGLNLVISGGEPMLHPDFCDFISKAKYYDFSLIILSNLVFFFF